MVQGNLSFWSIPIGKILRRPSFFPRCKILGMFEKELTEFSEEVFSHPSFELRACCYWVRNLTQPILIIPYYISRGVSRTPSQEPWRACALPTIVIIIYYVQPVIISICFSFVSVLCARNLARKDLFSKYWISFNFFLNVETLVRNLIIILIFHKNWKLSI